MTRLWTEGVMIEVRTDGGGQPLAFQWARYLHQVTQVANRWRVHTLWWREEIWREYFKVLTDSDFGELSRAGLLCTLYHDLLADRWYLERVYD